jgi:NAD(P)-dependent dehydrogenase (short-subunit alcohol dehydrogenase family)
MSKNKKTVVIFGGSGNIGLEIIKNLNLNNYNIYVVDKISEKDWIKNNIDCLGYYQTDINDSTTLINIIDRISDNSIEISSVINVSYPRSNAYGIPLEDVSLKIFNENVNLHLGGYYNVMRLFIKLFLKQGHGNIINFSSILGVATPKFDHYLNTSIVSPIEYTAVKSAIISVSKYLAKYHKNKNIRINCISPGGIFNNQDNIFVDRYKKDTLNKGLLDSKDIVGTVNFLLSDDSEFINGQNIVVDDGWSL